MKFRRVPFTIHFLGLKPWACYRDYDCNWDMVDRRVFASDSAHRSWWRVYDAMPRKVAEILWANEAYGCEDKEMEREG
ncbi:hypothetical protein OIU85_005032 [Salix viminalis]|uniref:Uncharacterized protein n=1 Tax=Salix viminalis TaxID=40686 RepID=A0A9Q0PU37_SALVM|nr:hypothetical protein OIU85_005032 [Salix viminalis]